MSEPNLNAAPARRPAPPERFDLRSHVHEERPFVTGFKMLLCVCAAGAALAASVLGGAYLLAGGRVPDFAAKPEAPRAPGDPNKPALTREQQKTFQEEVDEMFASYRDASGPGLPAEILDDGFESVGSEGKRETSPNVTEDGPLRVSNVRVASLTQVSATEAIATVQEVASYDTTIQRWYLNAGRTAQSGGLNVERVIEYEYRLVNRGRWKLRSRKWLKQSAALIQQAGEGDLSIPLDSASVAFEDKRPNKESLKVSYDSIQSDLTSGRLSTIGFPAGYSLTYTGGGTIARQTVAERVDRFKRNAAGLSIEYVIESVDQKGTDSAEATVRYTAKLTPADSKTGNLYVAVWRDRDTWLRAGEASSSWYRSKTERTARSPILQHYEDKIPLAPTVSPGEYDAE